MADYSAMIHNNRHVARIAVFLVILLAGTGIAGAMGLLERTAALKKLEDTEFLVIRRVAEDFAQGLASGVVLDQDQLVLKPIDNGILTPYGEFQSPLVDLPSHVNGLLLSFVGSHKGDSVMGVWLKVTDVNGTPSRWIRIERETEVVMAKPIKSYRYRILLVADDGKSPAFEAISIYGEQIHAPVPTVGLGAATTSLAVTSSTTGEAPIAPATIDMPPVVERPSWSAQPPKDTYTLHKPEWLVVHHTAVPTIVTYQGTASIRGIQKAHFARGWIDIGYHFLIGPDGKIYRGRPANVRGAHTIPNSGKVGISLIGNFMEEEVPEAARASLVQLLAWLSSDLGLPVEKTQAHRDFSATLCPGTTLYDEMPAIRAAVKALLYPTRR